MVALELKGRPVTMTTGFRRFGGMAVSLFDTNIIHAYCYTSPAQRNSAGARRTGGTFFNIEALVTGVTDGS